VPATREVALMREQVARVGDGVLLQGIRAYLRRDFHPSQIDDAHLAAAYLARAGLEPVEEKA
jgi:predicted metal-dependent hydrolase